MTMTILGLEDGRVTTCRDGGRGHDDERAAPKMEGLLRLWIETENPPGIAFHFPTRERRSA